MLVLTEEEKKRVGEEMNVSVTFVVVGYNPVLDEEITLQEKHTNLIEAMGVASTMEKMAGDSPFTLWFVCAVDANGDEVTESN